MNEFGKRLFARSSYRIYRAAERWLGHPDIAVAEERGRRLGDFWYRVDRPRRDRAYANLELAFPEWPEAERRDAVRDVFRHFGYVAADFMRTPHRTNEELVASMSYRDMAPYEEARALGKGIIAVVPHLGNWERFGHWLLATDRMITVVARDADASQITQRVNELRTRNGMGVLSRGDSAREILRLLRRKEIVGLLADQNSRECFVPFFGHPAGTVMGPAVLSIRTGAPLLTTSCLRTGVGRYEIVFEPPIFARPGETPEELTARVNLATEAQIRKAPRQYLWVHDRWKSARRRGMLDGIPGEP